MKKIIALFLCLLVVILCFIGCQYLGVTEEYELYDKFAKRHKAGMTKQEVFDKLGCPDGYYANGESYNIEFDSVGKDNFEASLSYDTSILWWYMCAQLGDSDYYTLNIKFDSEGKTVSAEMKAVVGG